MQRIRFDRIGQTEEGECPVRRLLVIDADHHFAGILSPGELATRLDEGTDCGHTLACISSPSAPAHSSTASFAMSPRSTAPPAPCAWLQRLAIAVLRPCCAPACAPDAPPPGALSPWNALTQRYSRPAFQAAILSPRSTRSLAGRLGTARRALGLGSLLGGCGSIGSSTAAGRTLGTGGQRAMRDPGRALLFEHLGSHPAALGLAFRTGASRRRLTGVFAGVFAGGLEVAGPAPSSAGRQCRRGAPPTSRLRSPAWQSARHACFAHGLDFVANEMTGLGARRLPARLSTLRALCWMLWA